MNLGSDIAFAEAAVHVCAAISYGLLYLRASKAMELASFATVSAAAALYCFAHGQVLAAGDGGSVAASMSLEYVALAATLLAFSRFARDLVGVDDPPWAARIWAGLGLVLSAGGLFADPARVTLGELAPRATPLALGWMAGTLVLAAAAISELWTRGTRAGDPRVAMVTCAVAVLALGWDTAASAGWARGPRVFGHATLVGSVGVTYVLLSRLVKAGDELLARTRALRRSYAELRLAQESLVHTEQLAAVGELSAVIAHEVRNPLAVLKNATSALGRPDLPPTQEQALLAILDEETDRLNRLVNDLLAYARPLEPQLDEIDLQGLIERAAAVSRNAPAVGGPAGLTVELDGEDLEPPVCVWADANLLERAFANVIDNAIDAMDGAGHLTVSARAATLEGDVRAVRLAFRDSGEGMDTQVRKRATDPFFTTRPQGTGLGLAIVDRVVRAHGGRMEIASRQEQGTEVALILPRDAPDDDGPTSVG